LDLAFSARRTRTETENRKQKIIREQERTLADTRNTNNERMTSLRANKHLVCEENTSFLPPPSSLQQHDEHFIGAVLFHMMTQSNITQLLTTSECLSSAFVTCRSIVGHKD
jgi:hypothetical protein